MKLRGKLLATVLALAAAAPAAQAAEPDYQALNAALVEDYVLPRYEAFAEATASLDAALTEACADGRPTPVEAGPAYHAAMDAWMAVQHLRFGPSELFLRADRTAFWPDTRNTVGRHLAQLLAARDARALAPETFASGSVAVQGFPALERLLFDSEPEIWATPFGCDVVWAIGANLEDIGAGLLADWRGGEVHFAQVVLSAGDGNSRYFDAKEATLDFAKALRGALLLAQDFKLGRPLGDKPEASRATRAESWRSARSLRNVLINLTSARDLYQAGGDVSLSAITRAQPQGAELDEAIRAALERLVAAVEQQPDSLVVALEAPDGWQTLDAIRVEARQLLELLGGPLSQVLGLPMGFNSYDGD
ncbi:MAG: imelysin family protein [Bacteroidota bacterium]|nr:imelysin family protein [Kiloniellaceae bacterium]